MLNLLELRSALEGALLAAATGVPPQARVRIEVALVVDEPTGVAADLAHGGVVLRGVAEAVGHRDDPAPQFGADRRPAPEDLLTMHEASLVGHIIRGVTEKITDGTLEGRVLTVYLRVGKMSSAVPEHLRFFFGLLTEGTPLEGAALDIEMVPVRCRCGDCGIEFENDNANLACTGCASGRLEVITGRELLIESVEVE